MSTLIHRTIHTAPLPIFGPGKLTLIDHTNHYAHLNFVGISKKHSFRERISINGTDECEIPLGTPGAKSLLFRQQSEFYLRALFARDREVIVLLTPYFPSLKGVHSQFFWLQLK